MCSERGAALPPCTRSQSRVNKEQEVDEDSEDDTFHQNSSSSAEVVMDNQEIHNQEIQIEIHIQGLLSHLHTILTDLSDHGIEAQARIISQLELDPTLPPSNSRVQDRCGTLLAPLLTSWKKFLSSKFHDFHHHDLYGAQLVTEHLVCKAFDDLSHFGSHASLSIKLAVLRQLVEWHSQLKTPSDDLRPSTGSNNIPHLQLDQASFNLEQEPFMVSSMEAEIVNNFPVYAASRPFKVLPAGLNLQQYLELKQTLALQLLAHFVPHNSFLFKDPDFLQHHLHSATRHIVLLLCQASRDHADILLDDIKKLAVDLVLLVKLRLVIGFKRQFSVYESSMRFLDRVLFQATQPLLSVSIHHRAIGNVLLLAWEQPVQRSPSITPKNHFNGGESCFKNFCRIF